MIPQFSGGCTRESSNPAAQWKSGRARPCRECVRAEVRRRGDASGEAPTGGAAAGEDLVGPRDPHDDRPAPASSWRLRAEGRQARRQDPDPQLRARRRRHVAVVGHGEHGGRHGGAAAGSQSRRPRRRGRRHDHRARAAAAWLRRHHLRRDAAARRHLELVAGRVHADLRVCPPPPPARRNGPRSSPRPWTSPTAGSSC